MVFKTNYRLMLVKSITECSKGSILQYFRPWLSYQLLLRSLFWLFWMAVLHMFYCKANLDWCSQTHLQNKTNNSVPIEFVHAFLTSVIWAKKLQDYEIRTFLYRYSIRITKKDLTRAFLWSITISYIYLWSMTVYCTFISQSKNNP